MLQTYRAELSGSQLIWIDQPPVPAKPRRVVVVVEDEQPPASKTADVGQAFLQARGCLGRAPREQVLSRLDALREDWSRDPQADQPEAR